jgi:hypothetical protein
MSTKFKLISFPEAKKRIERKKFWKSLWDKLFVRKTGKVTLHSTGIITENEEAARKALILFVGKLK